MNIQTLNQLLAAMEEQVKVMSDLGALSKKKSQILVDGQMDQLDILLRAEQALIYQMGRLEERRFQLQMDLAVQLNIHASQLTLEHLLKSLTSEHQDLCKKIAEQYTAVARDLNQSNQLNAELIQQAMAYVDFSLQFLGAAGPGSAKTYSAKGQRPTDGKLRRLDNRV